MAANWFIAMLFLCAILIGDKFAASNQLDDDDDDNYGVSEEVFYKICFTKFILTTEAIRHQKGSVADELWAAREVYWDILEAKFKQLGGSNRCSLECYQKLISKSAQFEEVKSDLGGEHYSSRCIRWAKFDRLCTLTRLKPSGGSQLFAIERWLCETKDRISMGGDEMNSKCFDHLQKIGQREAEFLFHSIVAYSAEQLDEAKAALESEIEAAISKKEISDAEVIEATFANANKMIDNLTPEFSRCSATEIRRKPSK